MNYGYAIFRAACARALLSVGLNPAYGLFHHRMGSSWCLADDMMEPWRPFIDMQVKKLLEKGRGERIGQAEKSEILALMSWYVLIGGRTRPCSLAIVEMANSLANALIQGKAGILATPTSLPSQNKEAEDIQETEDELSIWVEDGVGTGII